ncbi:MAG: aminopeptidase, partial [Spirochaetota bacterium]
FIGDTAAAYYLETAYGPTSPEVTKYRENLEDSRLLNRHLVRGAERLRILYASFDDDPSLTPEKKKEQIRALIRSIMDEAASLPYHTPERFARFREFSPNNAWFTGFLTYNEDVSALQEEFVSTFGSDYRKMIAHYRKMHMK